MNEHITTESKNGVLHIIFNRPEKRNALTRAMYAGFAEGIDKAEKDPWMQDTQAKQRSGSCLRPRGEFEW